MAFASFMHSRPIPLPCIDGSTAIVVRYTGVFDELKYRGSIAHGFRRARRNVATTRDAVRPSRITDRLMSRRTVFSEAASDQCPEPCRDVSSSAVAARRLAISAASPVVAGPNVTRVAGFNSAIRLYNESSFHNWRFASACSNAPTSA